MWCTNYNFYDNKVLSFTCALLLIYITTIFSAYNVSGRGVENLKTCDQGIFHGSEPVKNPVKWEFAWQLHACCHIPPPPKKIQCWSLISAPERASEQHWSIHLLNEGRGHRRISVLWVRKYKTYFVQDSMATCATLKIITKEIFSWKAWLNETINIFSSHMKLDKINCILIDDGLLNLKDLEILTSVVSEFK